MERLHAHALAESAENYWCPCRSFPPEESPWHHEIPDDQDVRCPELFWNPGKTCKHNKLTMSHNKSCAMSHIFERIWDAASCLQKMRVHVCMPAIFSKITKWRWRNIRNASEHVTRSHHQQHPATQAPRLWLMMFFCQGWGCHHNSTEHLTRKNPIHQFWRLMTFVVSFAIYHQLPPSSTTIWPRPWNYKTAQNALNIFYPWPPIQEH